MNILIFITIIIINFILFPSVTSLNSNELTALTDMYNEWNTILGWKNNVSNACTSWIGIGCNSAGNVKSMFVKNINCK